MPKAQLRRPFYGLGIAIVLVAVVGAACGSDDGGNEDRTDSQAAVSESSGPAASDEASTTVAAEYGEAIGAINDRLETRSEEIFAPVNQAFATLSPEGVLGVIANALPLASEATAESLRALRALTPPDQFVADHARLIQGWEDSIALYAQGAEAAQARDVGRSPEAPGSTCRQCPEPAQRSIGGVQPVRLYVGAICGGSAHSLAASAMRRSSTSMGLRAGMREFVSAERRFRSGDQHALCRSDGVSSRLSKAADVGKAFEAA